jgi:hypothetical protein
MQDSINQPADSVIAGKGVIILETARLRGGPFDVDYADRNGRQKA